MSANQRAMILGEKSLPVAEGTSNRTALPLQTAKVNIPVNIPPEQQEALRRQFSDLAGIRKGVPSSLSSRFVGAVSTEGGAAKLADGSSVDLPPPEEDDQNYHKTAASMNMFGRLTRSEQDWVPASLLCKRFNLRCPHPTDKKQKGKKAASEDILQALASASVNSSVVMGKAGTTTQTSVATIANTSAATSTINRETPKGDDSEDEEEKDNQDDDQDSVPIPERPSLDIFKAIFDDEPSVPEEPLLPPPASSSTSDLPTKLSPSKEQSQQGRGQGQSQGASSSSLFSFSSLSTSSFFSSINVSKSAPASHSAFGSTPSSLVNESLEKGGSGVKLSVEKKAENPYISYPKKPEPPKPLPPEKGQIPLADIPLLSSSSRIADSDSSGDERRHKKRKKKDKKHKNSKRHKKKR
eukprot:TRINITY_DN1364_c0_g1_i1.p1 TRINITY_DN1364_c0_g1~~TRINITY_DN1364_c0_g1_i1.p1  ORF type:complete len:480 (-),score=145.75 TRINITY_DN1364_c0_g1_i1:50-1279(-)